MSGQIPKYGDHLRRISIPRDFINDYSHTEYVSKRNHNWSIRSNGNSEKWWIFHNFTIIAGPFDTMGEAMERLVYALWQLYGDDNESMPRFAVSHRNKR